MPAGAGQYRGVSYEGKGQYLHPCGEYPADHQEMAVLGEGDFIGEAALLGDSVRTATVRALMESTLLRITQKTIEKISEQYPVVAERLQKELKERMGTSPNSL